MVEMAHTTKRRLRNTAASHLTDIEDEIENALATLADLDQLYGSYRMMLERWSGPDSEKQSLSARLEVLHREDRQPLVMRLADLHEKMMTANDVVTLH
jgi:hypothetical protein